MNPRPKAYESSALPLSYSGGTNATQTDWQTCRYPGDSDPAFVAQPEHCAKATIGRQEAIGNESAVGAHSDASRSTDSLVGSDVETFKPVHSENSSDIAKILVITRTFGGACPGISFLRYLQAKGLPHSSLWQRHRLVRQNTMASAEGAIHNGNNAGCWTAN